MTRFLASPTLDTLLADLASYGFVFDNPNQWDIIHHEGNDAIFLGHVPIPNTPEYIAQYIAETSIDDVTLDENDEIIIPTRLSTDFCANVTSCEGHPFATEVYPETPYNKFAE